MQHLCRILLASAVFLVATSSGRGEDFSDESVFVFAPVPSKVSTIPRADVKAKLNPSTEIKVRPNTGTELYLWVRNPKEDDADFIVEMESANGTIKVRSKELAIPKESWVRVTLPKPAPPAVPAVVAPPAVVTPGAVPVAPPEPPPPGIELVSEKGKPRLTFRLLDKNGKEVKNKSDSNKPYGLEVPIGVLAPSEYLSVPDRTVKAEDVLTRVTMVVKQLETFHLPGTATVQVSFPRQEALKGAVVREGFYRRNLRFDAPNPTAATLPAVTLTGTIQNAGKRFRVYVGVDGIDRAFPYLIDLVGKSEATPDPDKDPVVRLFPGPGAAVRTVTQPIGTFPVLIEMDNPEEGDVLELKLNPIGADAKLTDVIRVGPPRDVKVWLDAAGPTDGGLLFTTRSRDWIKPIDLTQLHGKFEVQAVLRRGTTVKEFGEKLSLTVDSTPPEPMEFLPVPKEIEKGQPLTVAASAFDPETAVVKATFFLFKQLDDGKIPADAIKAIGTRSEKDPAVWVADLKIPPDFRGDGLVGVVFTNQAGLSNETPKVQEVRIVEAPKDGVKSGTGTIEGKVEYGGRLQPGVPVLLRDLDGKEKGVTMTVAEDDPKTKKKIGTFKFEKVPVGIYTVSAARKDSSSGTTGSSPVTVEADKTAKPIISLTMLKNK